ncbi:MAG: hypothetical protein ABIV26_09490 [Candidatus Limnocylindrales bacterium]
MTAAGIDSDGDVEGSWDIIASVGATVVVGVVGVVAPVEHAPMSTAAATESAMA